MSLHDQSWALLDAGFYGFLTLGIYNTPLIQN